jgi:hypothetical protein
VSLTQAECDAVIAALECAFGGGERGRSEPSTPAPVDMLRWLRPKSGKFASKLRRAVQSAKLTALVLSKAEAAAFNYPCAYVLLDGPSPTYVGRTTVGYDIRWSNHVAKPHDRVVVVAFDLESDVYVDAINGLEAALGARFKPTHNVAPMRVYRAAVDAWLELHAATFDAIEAMR